MLVGTQLHAGEGLWRNSPTSFAYQWQRGGQHGESLADIGGETSSAYTVVEADAAHTLRCVVSATNTYGTSAGDGGAILLGPEPPTDMDRTFAYGPGGERGHECVLAVYKAIAPGSPIAVLMHEGGGTEQPIAEEPEPGEKTWPAAEASEAVKHMEMRNIAADLRAAGFAVVNINWRQDNKSALPGWKFEANDLMRAIEWAKAHAGLLNGDASKVVLLGASFGSYICGATAFALNKRKAGYVKGVAMLSGLCDFPSRMEYSLSIGDGSNLLKLCKYVGAARKTIETEGFPAYWESHPSILSVATAISMPTLLDSSMPHLWYGVSESEETPVEQLTRMTAAIEAAGLTSKYKGLLHAGGGHGIAMWGDVKAELIAFLEAAL
jgi:hypothetical protein